MNPEVLQSISQLAASVNALTELLTRALSGDVASRVLEASPVERAPLIASSRGENKDARSRAALLEEAREHEAAAKRLRRAAMHDSGLSDNVGHLSDAAPGRMSDNVGHLSDSTYNDNNEVVGVQGPTAPERTAKGCGRRTSVPAREDVGQCRTFAFESPPADGQGLLDVASPDPREQLLDGFIVATKAESRFKSWSVVTSERKRAFLKLISDEQLGPLFVEHWRALVRWVARDKGLRDRYGGRPIDPEWLLRPETFTSQLERMLAEEKPKARPASDVPAAFSAWLAMAELGAFASLRSEPRTAWLSAPVRKLWQDSGGRIQDAGSREKVS